MVATTMIKNPAWKLYCKDLLGVALGRHLEEPAPFFPMLNSFRYTMEEGQYGNQPGERRRDLIGYMCVFRRATHGPRVFVLPEDIQWCGVELSPVNIQALTKNYTTEIIKLQGIRHLVTAKLASSKLKVSDLLIVAKAFKESRGTLSTSNDAEAGPRLQDTPTAAGVLPTTEGSLPGGDTREQRELEMALCASQPRNPS